MINKTSSQFGLQNHKPSFFMILKALMVKPKYNKEALLYFSGSRRGSSFIFNHTHDIYSETLTKILLASLSIILYLILNTKPKLCTVNPKT